MADLSIKPGLSKAEKLKRLDKVSAAINEKAGKKIIGRVGADEELMERLRINWIPTPSNEVNEATGGGFPRRRTTIIAGKSDSGKTGLVLETIARRQQEDPDFVAAWLESENSLDDDFMFNVLGIDKDRLFLIEHDRKLGGEVALDQLEAVIATGACDLVCINSLKCIVPSEEFKKSITEAVVGTQARMNARMMRKYTALVAESDAAFIIITHLTTQIGSMSKDPLVISGGNAIMYGSALTLDLRKQSLGESDPIDQSEGIKVGVSVRKNHCVAGKMPYVKTAYYAVFGEGIEQYLPFIDRAVDEGVIAKSGAFFKDVDAEGNPKVIDGVKYQWQGKAAFKDYLRNNPAYFEELKARVSGTFVQQMDDEEISATKADMAAIEGSVDDDVIAEVNGGVEGTGTKRKRK